MENLYNVNGLIFWTEEEINLRKMFEKYIVDVVSNNLKTQNRGFEIIQVEAPLLTPRTEINPNYTSNDMFAFDDLVMRPETTMGSYRYIQHLLSTHNARKIKLPLCVWQHGKSFRREQDQPTKLMRLKEFYQLEFQIAYSPSTMNDYSVSLTQELLTALSKLIGSCKIEVSDRIPDYSKLTTDIICKKSEMKVCSISKRKDLPEAKVLEVAIGTDRCLYNFKEK